MSDAAEEVHTRGAGAERTAAVSVAMAAVGRETERWRQRRPKRSLMLILICKASEFFSTMYSVLAGRTNVDLPAVMPRAARTAVVMPRAARTAVSSACRAATGGEGAAVSEPGMQGQPRRLPEEWNCLVQLE